MSKHYEKQLKIVDHFKGRLMQIHRNAHRDQIPLHKLLDLKSAYIFDHPDYMKLTRGSRAILSGYADALFSNIQMNLTKWLMYYTNKNDKVVYVEKWDDLPEYIKENGKHQGNHFWIPQPGVKLKDKTPQPFGDNPSTGVAMVTSIKVDVNTISPKRIANIKKAFPGVIWDWDALEITIWGKFRDRPAFMVKGTYIKDQLSIEFFFHTNTPGGGCSRFYYTLNGKEKVKRANLRNGMRKLKEIHREFKDAN